jgi:2-oxoglutarate dehydrogenase E2 component (dihydrolipoamide succinyltransferase)
MKVDIVVPRVGESVTSGVLATWLKKDGQAVKSGDEIFELETDKATLPVTATADGVLHTGIAIGTEIEIGAVVGWIDTEGSAASSGAPAASAPAAAAKPAAVAHTEVSSDDLNPAVRALIAENKLNPGDIKGSGPGGRILKEDVLAHIAAKAKPASGSSSVSGSAVAPSTPAPAGSALAGALARTSAANAAPSLSSGERQRRVPMTNLRKRIAERLVESKLSAAHLTTFNEVDMHEVSELRKRYKESFEAKHKVRLGFMSFFVKAAQHALAAFPEVNAYVDGTDIIYNDFYDISVAVGTDRGLITPVIRNVDQLDFAGVEAVIADYGKRAKEKKIMPDELAGGTFTISNGGVYGSMLSTPIPNPPQTAVLGMHSIVERPVVRDGQIVVRPIMYLALTYDHRILDGKDAIGFLKHIKDLIEDPSKMLLGL